MPFPTTNTSLVDYDVRIFFDGLLILSPVKDGLTDCCQVTVVTPHAQHGIEHQLTVDVYEDVPHPSPLVARLVGPLRDQFEVTIEDPTGVRAYNAPNDDERLDLALDLKRFHNDKPALLEPRLRHTLLINEGQLRAARMSGPVSRRPLGSPNGLPCDDLGLTAAPIEARLKRGTRKLGLKMGRHSVGELNDSKKYVIYIRNGRQMSIVPAPDDRLSDFHHYYHEPGLTVPGQKWDIYFKACNVSTKDTTRIPCMSVLFDGLPEEDQHDSVSQESQPKTGSRS